MQGSAPGGKPADASKAPDACLMVLDDSDLARALPHNLLEALRDHRKHLRARLDHSVNCTTRELIQKVVFSVTPRQLRDFVWERSESPLSGPCVARPFGEHLKENSIFLLCSAALEYPQELSDVLRGNGLWVGSGLFSEQRDATHAKALAKKGEAGRITLAESVSSGLYEEIRKTYVTDLVLNRVKQGKFVNLVDRLPGREVTQLVCSYFVDEKVIREGIVIHQGVAYVPVLHGLCSYIKTLAPEFFSDIKIMATGDLASHTMSLPTEVLEAIIGRVRAELEEIRRGLDLTVPGLNAGALDDASRHHVFVAYARPGEQGVSASDLDGHVALDKEFSVTMQLTAFVLTRSLTYPHASLWPVAESDWCVMPASVPVVDIAVQKPAKDDVTVVECKKIPSLVYSQYMTSNDVLRTDAKKQLYATGKQ